MSERLTYDPLVQVHGANSGNDAAVLTGDASTGHELVLIRELTAAISGALDLHEAYVQTLHRICVNMSWDFGEAWIPAKDGESLIGTANWTADEQLAEFAGTIHTYRFRAGEGLPGRAWSTREPRWVDDVTALSEAEFLRLHEAQRAGLHAAAAIPLIGKDGPVAVLVFFMRTSRKQDYRLMQTVQAAVEPLISLMARLRMEGELEAHSKHLEALVEERTRSLKNSQEELRLKDRLASIGALAAGLGHDMNNVLLPVRAHLNALRVLSKRAGKQAGHVQQIGESIAYLQHLADGLHYLAVDPDSDIDTDVELDFAKWWASSSGLLANALAKRATLTVDIPTDLPPLNIGGAGLMQAILNLLVNAGEAIEVAGKARTDQGVVHLWAKVNRNRTAVRIGVTDNGCGMTAQVKRRSLDLFFSTRTRGIGTGLGLTLVQKVVSRAGGKVRIISTPNRGTTVELTVRCHGAQRAGVGTHGRLEIANSRTRSLVQTMLESGGVTVDMSGSPNECHVWIGDATDANLKPAAAWRSGMPKGRLVLVGAPRKAKATAWRKLAPLAVIQDPTDFAEVRAAIGLASKRSGKGNSNGKKTR